MCLVLMSEVVVLRVEATVWFCKGRYFKILKYFYNEYVLDFIFRN